MPTRPNLSLLAKEAKQFHAQHQEARAVGETGMATAFEKAWQCGKRLNAIKETVGHGNWYLWLENNWPELETRTAQNWMKIDAENPNALRVADLKFDNVRKYRLGYVPEKKRPAQKGDKKISKPVHHLGVVIECNKFSRRVDAGHYQADEAEMLRDFRPFFDWLGKRYAAQAK